MSYKIINALLTINRWSRPQKLLTSVKAIVIHYVANPMSTAMGNRNYFEDRKLGKTDYGSAHEIIDLNGDIVVCVPENELTYNCGSATYTQRCLAELMGSGSPNYCTYGIECTHIDWNGKMTDATYNTLVERCADLCIKFKLDPIKDIWTHKEVVGWKDCHLFFVKNPNEYVIFKQKVADMIKAKTIPQWMIDGTNFLSQSGFIKSPHSPTEVISMSVFAAMINNFTIKTLTIDAIPYLCQNGFFSLKPDGTPAYPHLPSEQLTIGIFSNMYMNRLKDWSNTNQIQFLISKGFITSTKNPADLLTMGLYGAMMKNYLSKNGKV